MPHLLGLNDILLFWFNFFLVCIVLTSPPTAGWKLVRAGVVPLMGSIYFYLSNSVIQVDFPDTWGFAVLMIGYLMNSAILLVFLPPEETVYRIRPRSLVFPSPSRDNPRGKSSDSNGAGDELVPEPVPPAWSWRKFCWVCSLWWSFRGIGWNYCCPLPQSSLSPPFSRTSSRRSFLLYRTLYFTLTTLGLDFVRSVINMSHMRPFFNGGPLSKQYNDLTQWERAYYSITVAAFTWWSVERTHPPVSIIMVSLGGIMGWKGEMWEPWGWPPLFGSMQALWKHPGLSHMWSMTWHQMLRRWIYVFGWIGIGEKILRLPPSGPRVSKAPTPPMSNGIASAKSALRPLTPMNGTGESKDNLSTPELSRRTTPSHPFPTLADTSKKSPIPMVLSNMIKSLLVFTLTGLIHDQAFYHLVRYTSIDSPWLDRTRSFGISKGRKWTDALVSTPFFICQPFGIALESVVKRWWRAKKRSLFPAKTEPAWMVTVERLIGFIWTWTFLGWTAGWYVAGLARTGIFMRRVEEQESFSPFGGLIWGKWYH